MQPFRIRSARFFDAAGASAILATVVIVPVLLFGSCDLLSIARDDSLPYPTLEEVPADRALGVVWDEVQANPQLPLSDCPAWDCLGHTDPWVGAGPDGQRYAWFSAGGNQDGPVVGRATVGPDLAFDADPAENPVLSVLEDGWDQKRETVFLRFDETRARWTMWYLGYSESFFDDPAIGQMQSLDAAGMEWQRPSEPIYRPDPEAWDGSFVSGPTFIEVPAGESDSGQWRLYYSGAGDTVGIGLLTSDDQGDTWQAYGDNPVFEGAMGSWDEGILESSVRHVNGEYLMWYSGYEEPLNLERTPIYIGLARSDDGIHWTRSEYNPVLGPGEPGSWNDLRVVSPHVIVDRDGSLLLFAHAQSRDNVGTNPRGRPALGRLGVWRSRVPIATFMDTCANYSFTAPKAAKQEFLWRSSTPTKPACLSNSSWKVTGRGESSLSM
jgi:hypothetical protein